MLSPGPAGHGTPPPPPPFPPQSTCNCCTLLHVLSVPYVLAPPPYTHTPHTHSRSLRRPDPAIVLQSYHRLSVHHVRPHVRPGALRPPGALAAALALVPHQGVVEGLARPRPEGVAPHKEGLEVGRKGQRLGQSDEALRVWCMWGGGGMRACGFETMRRTSGTRCGPGVGVGGHVGKGTHGFVAANTTSCLLQWQGCPTQASNS